VDLPKKGRLVVVFLFFTAAKRAAAADFMPDVPEPDEDESPGLVPEELADFIRPLMAPVRPELYCNLRLYARCTRSG
jgi:hypothetical protein